MTPKTHPNHEIIGWCFRNSEGEIYYCTDYDTSTGYNMFNIHDRNDTICVLFEEINTKYKKVY
jgi:hypothetical protein